MRSSVGPAARDQIRWRSPSSTSRCDARHICSVTDVTRPPVTAGTPLRAVTGKDEPRFSGGCPAGPGTRGGGEDRGGQEGDSQAGGEGRGGEVDRGSDPGDEGFLEEEEEEVRSAFADLR